jgi:glycosyltransferase involved in cell wall biosynthesis
MSDPAGTRIHFAVPDAIDDPLRVSGGNVYDQRVRDGLRVEGWDVRMLVVPDDPGAVGAALSGVPDDSVVLIDGLIAMREPGALSAHASRLRIVVLAHMVAGALNEAASAGEGQALRAARRVIATSEWTRRELIARGQAEPQKVVVARPGTDVSAIAVPSPSGGRLLCVGTIAPHKGQDLLVRALAQLAGIGGWTCTLAGSLDAAPDFVSALASDLERAGLRDRVVFAGVLDAASLDRAYARTDLLVVPSRAESYGMVVGEALARGIPVVASAVGGIPEALTDAAAKTDAEPMTDAAAGILVPPDDEWALAVVLRQWLTDSGRRSELASLAQHARAAVRPWSTTTGIIAETLHDVAATRSAVSA